MDTCLTIRHVLGFSLIVTVLVIGVPRATQTASEEWPPARVITIQGQPLSRLLTRTTGARDTFWPAGRLEQDGGQISGVAQDQNEQPLAAQTVQLTRVFRVNGNRAEQIRRTATTTAHGRFSFMALPPGEYLLEVFVGDEVVASATATLADGVMQVSGLTLTQDGSASEGGGLHPAAWVAIGAGIGVATVFGLLILVLTSGH